MSGAALCQKPVADDKAGQMQLCAIALPGPFADALPYAHPEPVAAGERVLVPLGRGRRLGLALGPWPDERELPCARSAVRPIIGRLDGYPVLDATALRCLRWCLRYWRQPPGFVLAVLPPPMLRPRPLCELMPEHAHWRASAQPQPRQPSPAQAALLQYLQLHPGATDQELRAAGHRLASLRALARAGAVLKVPPPPRRAPGLPPLDRGLGRALDAIRAGGASLLEERRERRLHLYARLLAAAGQGLILAPDARQAARLCDALRSRGLAVRPCHGDVDGGERLRLWQDLSHGTAALVVGTRPALWMPWKNLQLIVVDEEQDRAYKGQMAPATRPSWHGRDLAVWRAAKQRIPVLLCSAAPSLESLHNCRRGRYNHLQTGPGIAAVWCLTDLRRQRPVAGLAEQTLDAIGNHRRRGGSVLMLLNRRGYAPALICTACAWHGSCRKCGGTLWVHNRPRGLRCHGCGARQPLPQSCPRCASPQLRTRGVGTQQLAAVLRRRFAGAAVLRLDGDSRPARPPEDADILVGTHLMAGCNLPRATLICAVDADQSLLSHDFRALERLGQCLTTLIANAAPNPQVILQSNYADHPAWRQLQGGYEALAQALLAERRRLALPPVAAMALVHARSRRAQQARHLLERLAALRQPPEVEVLGPMPCALERHSGNWRMQLRVHAPNRPALGAALDIMATAARRDAPPEVQLSMDMDPQALD